MRNSVFGVFVVALALAPSAARAGGFDDCCFGAPAFPAGVYAFPPAPVPPSEIGYVLDPAEVMPPHFIVNQGGVMYHPASFDPYPPATTNPYASVYFDPYAYPLIASYGYGRRLGYHAWQVHRPVPGDLFARHYGLSPHKARLVRTPPAARIVGLTPK
jgi:hypothetical protein